ncbi:CCA tRNA nucleotidyltransferase [Myxacorys almedinensis]|uniref:CCA tRNA nucleotidyltransferase n=1 Tax=Myxacorys almedinensis TaxID=2651157 RepID=UPI001EE44437|nr:CCA tRNA nucleotidyltransferase [Myxacorys almedinensis]
MTVLNESQLNVLSDSSVLSPQRWPFSIQWLPKSACLVGGTVRDALLGRESEYLDLDFVLPHDAVETATAIARHYRAGFVLLDAERQIARVVFEQGTADFARQVGSSLEADLRRRDFTVNAIAYNPHTAELLDPLGGYEDLQRKRLRMICAENLQEDPLRLLRAYRQASQLGFGLDPETQQTIRDLAPHLRRIAAERVQSELNYLLSTMKGTPWLKTAWEDGLLDDWFPDATAEGLGWVAAIDRTSVVIQETWTEFWAELVRGVRHSTASDKARTEPKASGSARTWVTIAKLASLLSSDPDRAEAQLWRLKYSRAEIQAVSTVLKAMPAFQTGKACCDWTLAEQYFFFQSVGVTFPAVMLLAIGSAKLSRGTAGLPFNQPSAEGSSQASASLIHRFLTPTDSVAHPTALATGQDLMKTLHIPAGPIIGRLLAALQLAHAEQKITDRAEALALAKSLLAEDSSNF